MACLYRPTAPNALLCGVSKGSSSSSRVGGGRFDGSSGYPSKVTEGPDRPGDSLARLWRQPAFQDRRHLSAGPIGWFLVGLGLACVPLSFGAGGLWVWPLLAAALVLIAAGTTGCIDLVVTSTEVRVIWWRRLVRHRVRLQDVQRVDVVIADNLVGLFGGYNSRSGLEAAMTRDIEGDRSVGHKAVRIYRREGRVIQIGSWQPTRFCEAVEAARAQLP